LLLNHLTVYRKMKTEKIINCFSKNEH